MAFRKSWDIPGLNFGMIDARDYVGAHSPGDVAQSLRWDAVSANRALWRSASLSLPGGSTEAFSLRARAKDTMRS
jgi:hypothetical protein